MKLFSKQLSTIYKNQDVLCLSDEETSRYPQLHQFLYVVGVESEIKEVSFCLSKFMEMLSSACLLHELFTLLIAFYNDPPILAEC